MHFYVTKLDGSKQLVDPRRITTVIGDDPADREDFLSDYANAGIIFDCEPYPYRKLLQVQETPSEISKNINAFKNF